MSSVVTPQSAVVVEDDPSTAAALERAISSLGYSVRIASTYNEACALLRSSTPDVALLDITLPDGDGLELIAQTNTQFIVITGDSSHDTAARCVRLKAADILLKPVCLADLRHALAHIVSSVATNDSDTTTDITGYAAKPASTLTTTQIARRKTEQASIEIAERDTTSNRDNLFKPSLYPLTSIDVVATNGNLLLSGESTAAQKLRQTIARIADSGSNTLITGETGVDKLSAARAIYQYRCKKYRSSTHRQTDDNSPGTEPKDELCKELCDEQRDGLRDEKHNHLYIVQCSNGDSREADRASTIEFSQCLERVFSQADPTRQVTLILDDIHALSPTRQKQLLERLTALEHQSCQSDQAKRRRLFQLLSTPNIIAIERSSPGADNNRITTALRTHLEQTRLIVPPLRNRREDIATIAEALLAALNTAHEEERKFDSNAYETMASHQWSGNMRQLTNAITQAYYNTSGPVELSPALDERLPITTATTDPIEHFVGKTFWQMEKELLLATWLHHNKDKKKTAETLGISLKTLYNRFNAYSIKT